jgi:hypothetical protein
MGSRVRPARTYRVQDDLHVVDDRRVARVRYYVTSFGAPIVDVSQTGTAADRVPGVAELPARILHFAVRGALLAYEFIITSSLQFFHNLSVSVLMGALFQVPIVAAVLSRVGLLDAAMMWEHRSYSCAGMLVVAAVSTPSSVPGKGF